MSSCLIRSTVEGATLLQADGFELPWRHIGDFVDEPCQQRLGVVGVAGPEVGEVLGGEENSDAELPSLQENLAQNVEIVLHDAVRLVDQEQGIDEAKLRIVTGIGALRKIDHVFVVEVEEQDDEHVAFLVPNAQRSQVDDRDAGEEFVEVPGVGRLFDEDLQIDQVGENAVGRVDLVADEGFVGLQDIDERRDAARRPNRIPASRRS